MRLVLSLLSLLLIAGTALAQEAPKAPAHPARQTWQTHFAEANAAHDGHLTLDEAKAGYKLIARSFDEIDFDHKGYVTENDVRAWRVLRKAAHRPAHPAADPYRPQHAFQVHGPNQPAPRSIQVASVPSRVSPAPRATRVNN